MVPAFDAKFQLDTNMLSRMGEQFCEKWQQTADDLQSTLTQAVAGGNPLDAWNSQVEFGMRNASRWFGWSGDATPLNDMMADILATNPVFQTFGGPMTGAKILKPQPDVATQKKTKVEPAAVIVDVKPEIVTEAASALIRVSSDSADAVAAEPVEAAAPEVVSADDDLKRIRGIGPKIEQKLQGQGFYRYADLASLDAAAIEALDIALNLRGRIEREDWVGQAQQLSTGA
jgi:predicted flap endonuclease-1-like 5' DNA nuclease